MVLIHGTPSSSLIWRDVVPALVSAGYRVHLFDLLGFGLSERPRDPATDTSVTAQVAVLQAVLDRWGLGVSNSVAESFFHSFKVEVIHGEQFATRAQLRTTAFEYIEVDYNGTCRHSHCGYISPVQFGAKAA